MCRQHTPPRQTDQPQVFSYRGPGVFSLAPYLSAPLPLPPSSLRSLPPERGKLRPAARRGFASGETGIPRRARQLCPSTRSSREGGRQPCAQPPGTLICEWANDDLSPDAGTLARPTGCILGEQALSSRARPPLSPGAQGQGIEESSLFTARVRLWLRCPGAALPAPVRGELSSPPGPPRSGGHGQGHQSDYAYPGLTACLLVSMPVLSWVIAAPWPCHWDPVAPVEFRVSAPCHRATSFLPDRGVARAPGMWGFPGTSLSQPLCEGALWTARGGG